MGATARGIRQQFRLPQWFDRKVDLTFISFDGDKHFRSPDLEGIERSIDSCKSSAIVPRLHRQRTIKRGSSALYAASKRQTKGTSFRAIAEAEAPRRGHVTDGDVHSVHVTVVPVMFCREEMASPPFVAIRPFSHRSSRKLPIHLIQE